jgi:L-asparaginase II
MSLANPRSKKKSNDIASAVPNQLIPHLDTIAYTMTTSPYLPVYQLTRGKTIESVHHGAVAVVDITGKLVAWYGDPETRTFLRSTAKPFQALPFIENEGHLAYGLTPKEIALLCASHSGTDEHVAVARSIQAKSGVEESELLCGVHEPMDPTTTEALRERKEALTPNRHNCSGKHSGMLAYAKLKQRRGELAQQELTYIDPAHPLQKEILSTFAEMCQIPVDQVDVGIDGCSAPNFAISLRAAALGFARLSDPDSGSVRPAARAAACHTITAAMMSHPEMVGGPGRFDTRLMQVTQGRMVSKGGAEAFQGIGIMPGALGPSSPAIGIALKIADGDNRLIVRAAVSMEVLRQLNALGPAEEAALSDFGPCLPRYNWRKIEVGSSDPVLRLNFA